MADATPDQLLELAGALEQRRGLAIVEAVTALAAGFHDGAFRAGFETACEEITLRLRTEVWEHCLPPVDALAAGVPVSHTDHPLRHHDRTCPACNPHGAVEPKPISREEFDARVRRHGYVDRVTGERVYDPDAPGVAVAHGQPSRPNTSEADK